MTPEHWQRVRPILESALELDPAKRASFLDGACADSHLREEVESPIAFREQAGTDARNPAFSLILNPDEKTQFRLPPGKHRRVRNPRGNRRGRHGRRLLMLAQVLWVISAALTLIVRSRAMQNAEKFL
jgi:hypothetical protein